MSEVQYRPIEIAGRGGRLTHTEPEQLNSRRCVELFSSRFGSSDDDALCNVH